MPDATYNLNGSPKPTMKRFADLVQRSIEEAIQEFVRKGLVVDSGQRRWSQRTGRYEIVWESKLFGKTFH